MINLFNPLEIERAVDQICEKAREIVPTEIVRLHVSEWAEKNRVLQPGLTPYPGPFTFEPMPYMKEIADCLSEDSNVREVALLKGSQIGATVALGENWVGYIIDAAPGPMMYVNGNAEMAGPQMELRIDAMINSAGIGHKIKSQHLRAGQRKTGDVKNRKEFPGGWIIAGGPKSSMIKRSFSAKYIYADEIDSWPESVGTEGDPVSLLRQRKQAYELDYKILWTSTPLYKHSSHILPLYKSGDQRKYFVPCKHCGHEQYLKWKQIKFDLDENNNLKYETDKSGEIITNTSVRYECEKCGKPWINEEKDELLYYGKWKPTEKSIFPGLRSYQIPGLMSPRGFKSWTMGVLEFLEAKRENDIYKLQVWTNNFLGEAFEDYNERINPAQVYARDKGYRVDTLPHDANPLFITIGADVQKDRIEAEVVAWGKDKESWSINYHIFPGDTSDVDDVCWRALKAVIQYQYDFPVKLSQGAILAGIDAGYRTDVVYEFCDRFDKGVHPVMGNDNLNKDKEYIKTWKVGGRAKARIDVNSDLLKQEIYKLLAKGKYESGAYPPGFCHFPTDYDREHYNRLVAEYRVQDPNTKKLKWDAGNRRNEQLDCRVYSMAMVYAYRQAIIDAERDRLEDKDYTISWPEFWEMLS